MADLHDKLDLFCMVHEQDKNRLPQAAKSLFSVLLLRYHNTATGQCNPGISSLMKATALGESAVYENIQILIEAGFLAKNGRTGLKRLYVFPGLEVSSLQSWTPPGPSAAAEFVGPACSADVDKKVRRRRLTVSAAADHNREENLKENLGSNSYAPKLNPITANTIGVLVKRHLRSALGKAVFESWFSRSEIRWIDSETVAVLLPSRFFADYTRAHFLSAVEDALCQVTAGVPKTIIFGILGKSARATECAL